MNNRKHYSAAISAFVIWGFFAIPLRALKAFSSGEILYFRILFSVIILLVILLGFRKNEIRKDLKLLKSLTKQERTKSIALTLMGGAILTVNWLIFIYIVNNVNIKTASFSYLICPVITAILGYVIIKEHLTTIQWIAVGLCGVSCILMGINSVSELGFSFITAFTYALYLITQRKNQGFDRLFTLGIQVLFSFLLLTLFFDFLVSSIPTSASFYSITFGIALIFTVLPLFLNLFALNKINSATIGILMYINPLFNFTLAIFYFHEEVSQIQFFGYLIIAIALVLFNYQNFKRIYR